MKTAIHKREKERNSFTLVEILVCVSVVSILAAILVPALKDAMDRTKTIACVSNLRQIALAITLYGDDNGVYPPCTTSGNGYSPEVGSLWSYAISRYLGKPDASPANGRNSRSPVLQCPASIKMGANILCTYVVTPRFGCEFKNPYPYSSRPAELIIVVDGNQLAVDNPNGGEASWFYDLSIYSAVGHYEDFTTEQLNEPFGAILARSNQDNPPAPWGSHVRFRHRSNTKVNALFADGHVASLKMNEVLVKNVIFQERWMDGL